MTLPVNILQSVATYAPAALARLENKNVFVRTFNPKFKNFQDKPANLGDTINIELPTRAVAGTGLVVSFQPTQQRLVPLTCDQAGYSAMAFDAQQFIFNAREYMAEFGMARVDELSGKIEANLALNAHSAVPVMTVDSNGQSIPTGALHTESGPYRFQDFTQGLNSFQQLAQMCAKFRNYGAAEGDLDVYLDDFSPVTVIGGGANQFVLKRNEELTQSWSLGTYTGSNAKFYSSNLLSVHTSGSVGIAQSTLTLTAVNDPTGAAITTLTFSGASASDANAIKSGDLLYFLDGVSGQSDMRYLTFQVHVPSQNAVQIRATADAASDVSGNVTVSVTPTLQSTIGANQNLNHMLQPGMQAKVVTSHRAGMIISGKAGYMAMPMLPDEAPFPTSVVKSKDVGASLRLYYGSRFGLNFRGIVNDAIWSSLVIPEYSMRICLPV